MDINTKESFKCIKMLVSSQYLVTEKDVSCRIWEEYNKYLNEGCVSNRSYQDDLEDVHVFWIDLKSPQKGARLY